MTGITEQVEVAKDATNVKPRAKSSAYAYFVKSCREEFKKITPGEKFSMVNLSKKCSEQWKVMTDANKSEFKKQAECDKERYDREMADYTPPSSGEESTKKRKRAPKEKKEKDPNAPKRPLTAFFIFINEKRSEVKEKNPKMSGSEVSKHLGLVWTNMSTEEKERFVTQATENKTRYAEKMADYKKSSGEEMDKGVVSEDVEDDKENEAIPHEQ